VDNWAAELLQQTRIETDVREVLLLPYLRAALEKFGVCIQHFHGSLFEF
jgi:hypothetical protein